MLRFTIRDAFWVTAVVGTIAGWWVDRSKLDVESEGWRRAYIMELHSNGGHVSFDTDDPRTLSWLRDEDAESRTAQLKRSLVD